MNEWKENVSEEEEDENDGKEEYISFYDREKVVK